MKMYLQYIVYICLGVLGEGNKFMDECMYIYVCTYVSMGIHQGTVYMYICMYVIRCNTDMAIA